MRVALCALRNTRKHCTPRLPLRPVSWVSALTVRFATASAPEPTLPLEPDSSGEARSTKRYPKRDRDLPETSNAENSNSPPLFAGPGGPGTKEAPSDFLSHENAIIRLAWLDIDAYPDLAGISVAPDRIRPLLETLVDAEIHSEVREAQSGSVTCSVTCSIPLLQVTLEALGRGDNEAYANRDAFANLIVKLYDRGILKIIFDRNTSLRDLEKIYKHAAENLCVPKFDIGVDIDPETGLNKYAVTIDLDELSLRATVTKGSLYEAMEKAIQSLNKKIAIVSAITDPKKDGVSKFDSNGILEFYEALNPNHSFRVEVEKKTLVDGAVLFVGSVFLKDKNIAGPILSFDEGQARDCAITVAAIALRRHDPELCKLYERSRLDPVTLNIGSETTKILDRLRANLQRMVRLIGYRAFKKSAFRDMPIGRPVSMVMKNIGDFVSPPRPDNYLPVSMLPVYCYRENIIELVSENQYSILRGANGVGKSTQVPQFLFEHSTKKGLGPSCNILVGQSHSASVKSTARQVASDRGRPVGDLVGYSDTVDPKLPRFDGSISFHTHGILLDLISDESIDVLGKTSHILIDDVENRNISTDLLMAYLKSKIRVRKAAGLQVPRVVIMGSNFDVRLYARYFQEATQDGSTAICPFIDLEADSAPIQKFYLNDVLNQLHENYDASNLKALLNESQTCRNLSIEYPNSTESSGFLKSENTTASFEAPEGGPALNKDIPPCPLGLVAATIDHIHMTGGDGPILAFLPTDNDIEILSHMLQALSVKNRSNRNKWHILKSPIGISSPTEGRHIILSTTSALSFAFHRPQFIVDTGLSAKDYDTHPSPSSPQACWISKAGMQDRMALAGHVQNGKYYALFTRKREQSFHSFPTLAISGSDLDRVCLDAKRLFPSDNSIVSTLSRLLEPPGFVSILTSIRRLKSQKVLDDQERLTSMGRLLSLIPLSPAAGKLIIFGIIFRCLEPLLILAAAIHTSAGNCLFNYQSARNCKVSDPYSDYVKNTSSEHIGVINAFKSIAETCSKPGGESAYKYCSENFLKFEAFVGIWKHTARVENMLRNAGLIPKRKAQDQIGGVTLNAMSSREPLLKGLLLRALLPSIAGNTKGTNGEWRTELLTRYPRIFLSPSLDTGDSSTDRFAVYSAASKVGATDSVHLGMSTLVPASLVYIFADVSELKGNALRINDWLEFKLPEHPEGIDGSPSSILKRCKDLLDKLIDGAVHDLGSYKLSRTSWLGASSRKSHPNNPHRIPHINTQSMKEFSRHIYELQRLSLMETTSIYPSTSRP